MDPVDLSQLRYELRSAATPATITIPAEKLTPGCVLSGGVWDRHVVVALPELLTAERQRTVIRHLLGGHRVSRRFTRSERVTIYRTRLAAHCVPGIFEIPRCFIPCDPQEGDRIVVQSPNPLRLGEGEFLTYNGGQWITIRETVSGSGIVRKDIRRIANIRAVAANPDETSPYGWYTYLPSGHRPYVYVDGRPMPARSAAELQNGDVLRLPGGGRLEVARATHTSSGTALSLRVIRRSERDLLLWMPGSNVEGTLVEHHDSHRTGSLYASEPRPSELVSPADVAPGDVIISMWGAPHSAVGEVGNVSSRMGATAVHMELTAVDGRRYRQTNSLDPRHVLLHRQPVEHDYAPAADILVGSHL